MPKSKNENIRINITMTKEIDKRFRDEVVKRHGFRRGSLQKAIEEAIELWVKTK